MTTTVKKIALRAVRDKARLIAKDADASAARGLREALLSGQAEVAEKYGLSSLECIAVDKLIQALA